jgi:hypothetical protein
MVYPSKKSMSVRIRAIKSKGMGVCKKERNQGVKLKKWKIVLPKIRKNEKAGMNKV